MPAPSCSSADQLHSIYTEKNHFWVGRMLQTLGLLLHFEYYNYVNPIMRSKYMSRQSLLWNMLMNEQRIYSKLTYLVLPSFRKRLNRRYVGRKNMAKSKLRTGFYLTSGIVSSYFMKNWINFSRKPTWYDQ